MCYTVPVVGAIVSSVTWVKTKSVKVWWLTLMFGGAALFGVIDHWWNGELFLVSENIGRDLLLGVVISAVTLIVWMLTLVLSRKNVSLMSYVDIKR